jgi:hypothetical protein
MWVIKNENQPNACMVTPWVSGYSVYVTNDYKRCVCDAWDPTNPDCLVVDTDCDPEDDSSNDDDNSNEDENEDENNDDQEDNNEDQDNSEDQDNNED